MIDLKQVGTDEIGVAAADESENPGIAGESDKKTERGIRDPSGRFLPGHSGNLGGRTPVAYEIKELARQHGPLAIETAVALLLHEDPYVRLAAARLLLDRGYGKPMAHVSNSGSPLVNISLNSPGALTPQEAYSIICGDPNADISGLLGRVENDAGTVK